MEPQEADAPAPAAARWYSRAAFDEFNVAADAERARLEALIADASARLARADAAVGLNRTMAEMIVDSQRELQEIRRRAERTAAEILAGDAPAPAPAPVPPPAPVAEAPVAERLTAVFVDPDESLEPLRPADDDYFARLKDTLGSRDGLGSLHDD